MFTNFKKKKGIVHLAMRPVIEVRFWKKLDKKDFKILNPPMIKKKNKTSETFVFLSSFVKELYVTNWLKKFLIH